jgi:hypothetical protein
MEGLLATMARRTPEAFFSATDRLVALSEEAAGSCGLLEEPVKSREVSASNRIF